MKKVIAYIDGFNFYHTTENNPSANINLHALAYSLLREGQELEEVHYFSAYAKWKPRSYQKHRDYIAKLTQTGVKTTLSHFKRKNQQCRVCNTRWVSHEEKETDVRISLQLFRDAVKDRFDTAFILSGDSDIVPAVQAIREEAPDKRLILVLPKHQSKRARDMKAVTHGLLNLSPARIRSYLFTD